MGRWGLRWRAGLVALLLVAAQGCWLQTGFGACRTGTDPLEQTVTAANVRGATRLPARHCGPAPSPRA
jgi:hypothetical protein